MRADPRLEAEDLGVDGVEQVAAGPAPQRLGVLHVEEGEEALGRGGADELQLDELRQALVEEVGEVGEGAAVDVLHQRHGEEGAVREQAGHLGEHLHVAGRVRLERLEVAPAQGLVARHAVLQPRQVRHRQQHAAVGAAAQIAPLSQVAAHPADVHPAALVAHRVQLVEVGLHLGRDLLHLKLLLDEVDGVRLHVVGLPRRHRREDLQRLVPPLDHDRVLLLEVHHERRGVVRVAVHQDPLPRLAHEPRRHVDHAAHRAHLPPLDAPHEARVGRPRRDPDANLHPQQLQPPPDVHGRQHPPRRVILVGRERRHPHDADCKQALVVLQELPQRAVARVDGLLDGEQRPVRVLERAVVRVLQVQVQPHEEHRHLAHLGGEGRHVLQVPRALVAVELELRPDVEDVLVPRVQRQRRLDERLALHARVDALDHEVAQLRLLAGVLLLHVGPRHLGHDNGAHGRLVERLRRPQERVADDHELAPRAVVVRLEDVLPAEVGEPELAARQRLVDPQRHAGRLGLGGQVLLHQLRQLRDELRVALEDRLQRLRRDHDHAAVARRHHRRRVRLPCQKRYLPEDLALRRHRDLRPEGLRVHLALGGGRRVDDGTRRVQKDLHLARVDDVELVARLPLRHDHVAVLEGDEVAAVGQERYLVVRQALEPGHFAESPAHLEVLQLLALEHVVLGTGHGDLQ